MGSKRLKAVAVRGGRRREITVADKDKLNAVREKFLHAIQASRFHQGLTSAGRGRDQLFGLHRDCPTKNWNSTGLDSMPLA